MIADIDKCRILLEFIVDTVERVQAQIIDNQSKR